MTTSLKKYADRDAVKNYHEVKANMKKAPTEEAPFLGKLPAELTAEEYKSMVSPEGHYRIYFKWPNPPTPDFTAEGLKWRLARMEETFSNFFSWFALQEKVVPPLPPIGSPSSSTTPSTMRNGLKEFGLIFPGDGYACSDSSTWPCSRAGRPAIATSISKETWSRFAIGSNFPRPC